MSELVIRDGINYGEMAVVKLGEIEFVVGVHHMHYLPIECVEVPAEEGRFQEFRKELLIEFEVSDFLRGRCYVFRKLWAPDGPYENYCPTLILYTGIYKNNDPSTRAITLCSSRQNFYDERLRVVYPKASELFHKVWG